MWPDDMRYEVWCYLNYPNRKRKVAAFAFRFEAEKYIRDCKKTEELVKYILIERED